MNDDVGWMAAGGSLLKTEDGGETWESIPLDDNISINLFDFINESVGWAVGGFYDEIEEVNLFYQSLKPIIEARINELDCKLHKDKQTDQAVESFNKEYGVVGEISTILCRHHQFETARSLLHFFVDHHTRQAVEFDLSNVQSKIQEVDNYLLNTSSPEKPVYYPAWLQNSKQLYG